MKKRDFVLIFLFGLAMNLVTFLFQSVPGYMDAEYYYSGGVQLFSGHGFHDPFIWNYLNNPVGIPVPSHAYWMPLASILAAAGLFLFQVNSFIAAKSLFLLLASIYPCLTASLAYRLFPNRGMALWVAGISLFSGFFFVFYTLTESFILYAVLGALLFHLIISLESQPTHLGIVFILGLVAGGLHLSRADGILWVLLLSVFLVLKKLPPIKFKPKLVEWFWVTLKSMLVLFAGYYLTTGFWYIRNILVWGSFFPPGGTLTAWITNYDQIFIFPISRLSTSHWLATGWGNILSARVKALGTNLVTTISVQGLILLFPAMIIGLWSTRKRMVTRIGVGMWLVILVVMSFVFPFAGARGGFFHSVAGVQPIFLAVAGIGMDSMITMIGTWRKWKIRQALIVFSSAALVICAAITGYLAYQRILRPIGDGRAWDQSYVHYAKMGTEYTAIVGDQNNIVAVNDPPGFYLATGLECVVIPDGDMSSLQMVSEKFGVKYVIVEVNTVKYLVDAYDHPGDYPGLIYTAELDGGYLYEIEP